MNPADPLQQLHPLREPAAVGWWPPAPGWWLLGALSVLALVGACWLAYSRYRRNAYRRQGLAALQALENQHRTRADTGALLTEINALLKSIALKAWPRRDIAALSGRQWLQFLNSTAPPGPRFEAADVTAQYREDPGEVDRDRVCRAAYHWIRRHEARHA